MQAELEEAIDANRPVRFAIGCAVSLRRMPAHAEGRFTLAAHAVALGLVLSVAALQISCALFGSAYFLDDSRPSAASAFRTMLMASSYRAMMPTLMMLVLLLGIGQFRMAWLLLERDWSRLKSMSASALATTITALIFMSLLALDVSQALRQAAILAAELSVLAILARWHAELPEPAPAEHATG